MTDRISFTVYRDKWLRGSEFDSRLLNEWGSRCCLGHLARDIGIADEEIECAVMPENVDSDRWPSPLMKTGKGSLAWEASGLNDDDRIVSEEAREHRLKALFAEHGIDVTFVDTEGK